jgi:hypothetical protein
VHLALQTHCKYLETVGVGDAFRVVSLLGWILPKFIGRVVEDGTNGLCLELAGSGGEKVWHYCSFSEAISIIDIIELSFE